jgi:hypothetical protein
LGKESEKKCLKLKKEEDRIQKSVDRRRIERGFERKLPRKHENGTRMIGASTVFCVLSPVFFA